LRETLNQQVRGSPLPSGFVSPLCSDKSLVGHTKYGRLAVVVLLDCRQLGADQAQNAGRGYNNKQLWAGKSTCREEHAKASCPDRPFPQGAGQSIPAPELTNHGIPTSGGRNVKDLPGRKDGRGPGSGSDLTSQNGEEQAFRPTFSSLLRPAIFSNRRQSHRAYLFETDFVLIDRLEYMSNLLAQAGL